ncbi:MAG: SDR family oxidoreductase [Deltaproteobacteria bacterium]|jgi:NAD(P)-dependent dehydrogenase (short-subunit alcohol dehydrogenase family)|nr:SDR family oxidoreductase [Deltaproteobacteria bacterium]
MMGMLQGKVAFITGAGSGIARAAARLFALEGARVVIAELKPELGRSSEEDVRSAGGDAAFIETDVTREENVRNAVRQSVARYGTLNILYNCAGGSINQDAPVTDVDMAVWQHTMTLDLLGTFLVCRHGIPELIKAGGGAIVNMSSGAALQGSYKGHVYTAAKGAILSLTRGLAGQYARHGIRANAICPGLTVTDRVIRMFGDPRKTDSPMKGMLEKYPFSVGDPEDIANVALFLASDKARMINGATIAADGGSSAY